MKTPEEDRVCDNCNDLESQHPRRSGQHGYTLRQCRVKGCTCGDFHRDSPATRAAMARLEKEESADVG